LSKIHVASKAAQRATDNKIILKRFSQLASARYAKAIIRNIGVMASRYRSYTNGPANAIAVPKITNEMDRSRTTPPWLGKKLRIKPNANGTRSNEKK
jgi:hypothetical protein